MSLTTRIVRRIEIDMGHRVTNHASKCRNVHGHRYVIEAEVTGIVKTDTSSEQGMVIDFGALKTCMMARIDYDYDHGLALWVDDPIVPLLVPPGTSPDYARNVELYGAQVVMSPSAGKVILLDVVPTAENLAAIWFRAMAVDLKRTGLALTAVTVYETPNCWATYRPEE